MDSRTTNHGLAAEVQSLEVRSLPTGTVTASLSNGALTIGGDNRDNSILITVKTTGIYLTGVQDAQTQPDDPVTFTKIKFAGTTTDDGTTVLLTDSLSLRSLAILMRGGKDIVRMNVGVAAADPDADAPNLSITGRIRVNLGAGDDHGALLLNNGTLTIGGNLEGDLENGDDCFLVSGTDPDHPVQVDGHVIILGRLGKDLIGLEGINVNKSVIINGGDHNDSIALESMAIKGNLSLDGYDGDDDLLIDRVTITGTTTIRGGSGNDRLRINELNATRNVAVYMGSGTDQLSVGTVTLGATTKVTLDGGSGTDALASESELTYPPYKVRGVENTAAEIDPQVIIDAIFTQVLECVFATEFVQPV